MHEFINVGGRDLRIEGRLLRIARVDGEKYRFLDNPESVVEGLRTSEKRVDLFTFMQRLPETQPKYSYPMEWDNFAALPVSTFEHWWTKQVNPTVRNRVKQAKKHGATLREIPFSEELVHGIWQIYNETPVRQGKSFPHYGMTLEQVHEYAATFLADSIYIGAFSERKLIGFAKLTIDESGTQAGLMHILSMISHREKAPTNALVAEAVRACSERQIAYLVYSNFAYGKKQSDGLSVFKERNGFRRIDVPRYYVPITPLGRAAYRLGCHRTLLDILPEEYIAKLRAWRGAWYSSRLEANKVL